MYKHIHRSVSEPSVGTAGTPTLTRSVASRTSHVNLHQTKNKMDKTAGKFLWEGHIGKITHCILLTPWKLWSQTIVLLTVIYKFLLHLLLAYYLDETWLFLDITIAICEVIFALDVVVHLLHAYWPLVRVHVRVLRRNRFFLAYDVVTIIPLTFIFKNRPGYEAGMILGRWLGAGRIYRLISLFQDINGHMHNSRKMLFFMEQAVTVTLILHASTCLWFAMNRLPDMEHSWYKMGYPPHVNGRSLKFDCYRTCWYYCTCRFFNVIFGDAFPMRDPQKWLTSCLMLLGYVVFKYRFIGTVAWELVLENSRRSTFVDQYHHMINYLKFSHAPSWLVDQCTNYKLQLWQMKDGILRSEQLHKLPLPLQMELIFDINVGHFHNSLLFRDTKESFMRQISLLMRHELYLAGQNIWSQGVVKSGMICIKRGAIEMLSDEDDESPMIAFKEGTVLGELSLFYSIPSKVTVKAATYVELQIFTSWLLP